MSPEMDNPVQQNPQQLACEAAREEFGAYLDSAMSGVEMQAIAGHLEFCVPCGREFAELRLLQLRLSRINDDIIFVVDDSFQLPGAHIQHQANPGRHAFVEPDM